MIEILDTLEDPRVDRTKLHNLTDILVLSVLVVICGADSFVAIALFGQLNEAWLRTFLELPHGIPLHDTLGRVFARLDTARFEEGFRDWVQEALALTEGQVVPVDGKSVRGSHDRGRGLGPLHLVTPGPRPTAWCWPRPRWMTSPTQARPSRSCCACCA
ncbi:MAG: ISAs1 family transposase [Caldilineaceae bacterium]|nr:ISAs1 family transposase [Caldilineaceae bacterium]